MKKIPREITGPELVRALRVLGYSQVRQDGSHIRLSTLQGGQNHVTVPNHRPIKVGTLRAILSGIANHHQVTVEVLLEQLDL